MTNRGPRVLVVEDDASLRYSIVQLLSYWGFSVQAAENGLDALESLKVTQSDILLTDLNMPGMDGYELLPIVRTHYPEMRLVAMSGAYERDEVPVGVVADAFYAKSKGPCTRLLALLNGAGGPQLSRDQWNRSGADVITASARCHARLLKPSDRRKNPAVDTSCFG